MHRLPNQTTPHIHYPEPSALGLPFFSLVFNLHLPVQLFSFSISFFLFQLFRSILIVAMKAAAAWFGGKIMDIIMAKLINACFEYLQDQLIWKEGMKEAVERLQKLHPVIQSVIFAYNQAQISYQNPALDRWLWQLRDVIDEADDLLDDFEYLKHKEQLTQNSNFLYESASKTRKVGNGDLKIGSNMKRLEEIVQKLDKLSAEVGTFLRLLEITKQEQLGHQFELCKIRETGSLSKKHLIGRVQDEKFIVEWLRPPSNEEHQTQISATSLYNNISFLSVVGHGGMGKTTLLQHVYENEITSKYDLKMWVCISNNFDVKRVIADMLESLQKKSGLKSLNALQTRLKSAVTSKKFLLVLDDIWEEEERDRNKWEKLLAPLAYGSPGSKILVTTRMDSVALMIARVIGKKKETLRLEGLKEDECLQLLNSHAFANVENSVDHKKLRSIAKEIVKKLSGSPLAAKVIGGVLNSSLDERHWIRVLNSDIGSIDLGQNHILPTLRLSYIFLPKPIQICFAFCSIFPRAHMFDKDDLVRMWIALGFIQQPSNREETVEDIGRRYFDILVKKSFFEEFHYIYKLHDLLHELAQFVSAQECYSVMGDKELPILETIRHLYVKTTNLEVLRNLRKFKNLHSLFLSYDDNDQNLVDVLKKIFYATTSIRLLYIDAQHLKLIPEEIGYLIHLRYLKLDHTSVSQLPRSISNLYHLQFIIYTRIVGSLHHEFLPKDMNNLFNLQCLDLPWHKFPGMHGIGKLISLKKLDGFHVNNEIGYKIGELEHMNELRQLSIYKLEKVLDAKEACNAKLSDKWNLMELSLQWSLGRNITAFDLDVEVLDNLQPHENLKILKINSYMSAKSSIWLEKANLISNLEYIKLSYCLQWQTLPPFGRLPFLKSLHLDNMPKVKWLDSGNDKDCVFPSLEVLNITKLEALEDWFGATATSTAITSNCLFPCLTELYLKDCPHLKELLSFPPKLKKLEINRLGWRAFNWLKGPSNCCSISIQNCNNIILLKGQHEVKTIENCSRIHIELIELTIKDPSVLQMVPLRSITSIKQLTIKDNDALDSFPKEVEEWFLQVSSSLCQLYFNRLKLLNSLPSFLNLSSLEFLSVEKVPQLQKLPDIPASLKRLKCKELESLQCLPSSLPISLCELHLVYLPKLVRLPSCFTSLSSLQKLHIHKVPLFRELRDPPLSLCELHLEDLDNLDRLPCLLRLSSLQKLQIDLVPQLLELPDLPPSLSELYLAHLGKLNHMPSCFLKLASLQKFEIVEVIQLLELPNLPRSLKQLTISCCNPELTKRYQKISGSDWEKIAYISSICIN